MHKEAEFLQKLLPGYYMNLNQGCGTCPPSWRFGRVEIQIESFTHLNVEGNCIVYRIRKWNLYFNWLWTTRLVGSFPSETMWLPSNHAESAHPAAQVFRNVHVHVQPEEHPPHRDEQPVAFQRQDALKVRPQGVHLQKKGEGKSWKMSLRNSSSNVLDSRPARRSVPRSLPRTRTSTSWRCFPKVFC